MNHRTLLIALGLAAAIPVAALPALGDLSVRTGPALLIWGAAHAFYLTAAWLALRGRRTFFAAPRFAIALVIAVGLIPRLALLPTAPTLSEDLYRYLWDGRLVAQGMNPYAHPPDDAALGPFRDELLQRLNHPSVPTVYPPAAQLLFGLAAAAGVSPLSWKLLLFTLEGALTGLLLILLRRRRLPAERLLLYYWNPLVIVECCGSGHVDVALATFLVLAVTLQETGRRAASGLAFGAAILTKWTPVLVLPTLIRGREWRLLAAASLLAALVVAPFLQGAERFGEGLRTYARHWEFNGPIYSLLRPAFRSGDEPRLILAALLALSSMGIAWRARTLSGAVLATWIAFLLLSPTVYPWYLVPAVALLPLHPNAGLLVLSGTAALTYAPLPAFRATGVWTLPDWILWVEYGAAVVTWTVVRVWARLRPADGVGGGKEADVEKAGQVQHQEGERSEETSLDQGEHGPREIEAK